MVSLSSEIDDIAPGIVTPVQMSAAFSDAAVPDARMAAPVAQIQTDNNARVSVASENIKQASAGIKELNKIVAEASPDTQGPGLATQVASTGVRLIETAASVAATVATGGVNLSGGGSMVTMGASSSLFKLKSSARDVTREGRRDMERDESGYGSSPRSPGGFDYSGGAHPVNMAATMGTPRDINLFRGGATRMAAIHGGDDLLPRADLTEQHLEGIETLKIKLEEQMEIAENSLQNAGEINVALNNRLEKGVATSTNTIEAALDQGQPELIQRGVTFGV